MEVVVVRESGVVMLGRKGRSREMWGWIGRGWFGGKGEGVGGRAAVDNLCRRKVLVKM